MNRDVSGLRHGIGVRRAAAGDEAALRALRLQALTDVPDAFGSTYEREAARTPADWQRWLSPGATFVSFEGDEPRGSSPVRTTRPIRQWSS